MVINQIPSYTWNHLRMNDAEAEAFSLGTQKNVALSTPKGVAIKKAPASMEKVKTGGGDEVDGFLAELSLERDVISVTHSTAVAEPLRANLSLSGEVAGVYPYEISIGRKSSLTMIFDISAEDGASGNVLLQAKYRLEEGASLTMVQVMHVSDGISFINDIGGECEEGAEFHLIQLVLGGGKTYLGSRTELLGKKSSETTRLGYLLSGQESLDVNYIVNHIGRKTTCDILANGVLKDGAKKNFKGTIDFKKGAAGSVGSELEDVLLMGEDITNQTLPVILCAEEDVEGNHGATIGELDEELMFYLQSRGMPRDAVYEMMSRAKIDVIKNQIKDEETRTLVDSYL